MSNLEFRTHFAPKVRLHDWPSAILNAIRVDGVFGSAPNTAGPIPLPLPSPIIPIDSSHFSGAGSSYQVLGNIVDDSTGATGGWILNEGGLYEVCLDYEIRSTTPGALGAGSGVLNATFFYNIGGGGNVQFAHVAVVLTAPTTIAGDFLRIASGCVYVDAVDGDVLRLLITTAASASASEEVLNRSLSIRRIQ